MEKKQTAKATVEIPITCPHCRKKLTAKAERRFLTIDDAIAFKNYLNVYGIRCRARFNNLRITRTKANK
tara:strand:- start:3591 stop:3797 length:207 start_codon:yes stop_codon:yes gene_type:complete